ncbi:hypothetical protein [Streptomyces sp. NPDC056061]
MRNSEGSQVTAMPFTITDRDLGPHTTLALRVDRAYARLTDLAEHPAQR